MTQLIITNIEEDIVASYLRNIQGRVGEILSDVENQTADRGELSEKVKAVEKQLKHVQQALK